MAGITNAMNLAHKGTLQRAAEHPAGRHVAGELLGTDARILIHRTRHPHSHRRQTRHFMRSLRRRSSLQIAAQSIMALALIAPAAFAQGRGGAQAPQVTSPEVMPDRKIAFRIYAPQAQAVRLNAGDIQGLGQNTALTKAENGVWEIDRRPGRSRHLSLQLQRRRRDDDRSAQPVHQRVEQQRLEHGQRARLRVRRHEERAARQRRARSPTSRRRSTASAGCTSTRRPATSAAPTSTRSSTCCTAPATATTPGPRSAAPASSSTT